MPTKKNIGKIIKRSATGLSDGGKDYVKTYLPKLKPTASMYKGLDKFDINAIKRDYQWLKKRENKEVFIKHYHKDLFNKSKLTNDEKRKGLDYLARSLK